MTAWSKMSADERDRVMLAAAFLNAPEPIFPRGRNEIAWAARLIGNGWLSSTHCITRKGKARLKSLGQQDTGGAG